MANIHSRLIFGKLIGIKIWMTARENTFFTFSHWLIKNSSCQHFNKFFMLRKFGQ